MKRLLPSFIDALHHVKRRTIHDVNLEKIPLVNSLRRLFIGLMKSDFVADVNGFKMFLDDKDSLGLSWHKTFEPAETDFFQKEIKVGDVIVDIGANIGYFTLLFARQTGPAGHVYAFEPDPVNFALLKKNIEINGCRNVTLVASAVSFQNGTTKLFLSEDNHGDHRIYSSESERRFVEVSTVRLDDYFAGKDRKIDIIKMDIQGAEGLALKGMAAVIDSNAPLTLVTEFSPRFLERSGVPPREFLQWLHELKLDFSKFAKNRMAAEPVAMNWLLDPKNFHGETDFVNLICRKPAR